MKSHKDLDVWKLSMKLVKETYLVTRLFPPEERYGLTQQMRRAAVSIPSNIAEGAGRIGPNEFVHFLSISSGSLSELETQYLIAADLEFLSLDELKMPVKNIFVIKKKISRLINALKRE